MARVRLEWRSFAFELGRPLVTAAGVVREKRGWLLRLRNERGQQGWGEAAPLQLEARPAPQLAAASTLQLETASTPQLAATPPLPALPALTELAAAIAELGEEQPREVLEAYLAGAACPPSLGFALGAALAEADGLVGGEGPPIPPPGASSPGQPWWPAPPGAVLLPAGEAMLPALEHLLHCADGASGRLSVNPLSAKWKVAAAADGQERALLELLLAQLPANARLRLDANGGWSRATAWGWAERLAGEPRLQWLEQPLASHDQAGLEALAARLPVALDESLQQRPQLRHSWPGWQVRRPSQEGDPRLLLAALAAGQPRLMLSTGFETGIGRRWLHHLAALQMRGPTPAAPGLASGWQPPGALFATDPWQVWEAAQPGGDRR
jgi:O-succinylbenzoate synthase